MTKTSFANVQHGNNHFFIASPSSDRVLYKVSNMWAVRALCAVRNAFWEFPNN